MQLALALGPDVKEEPSDEVDEGFGTNQQLDLVDDNPADKKSGTASKKTRRDSLTAIQLARTTVQTQLVI